MNVNVYYTDEYLHNAHTCIYIYLFNDILSYILARILITLVLIYSVIRRPKNAVGYA